MAAKDTISYTEKDLEAIKILEANRGQKLRAKDLGISTAILTDLYKKGQDARPMAEGFTRVVLNKEDRPGEVCPTCGHKIPGCKVYWID